MKISIALTALAYSIHCNGEITGSAQQPLRLPLSQYDLVEALKEAQIIPAIIDEFVPLLSINISWPKAQANIGNTVKPKKMKHRPTIQLIDLLPEASSSFTGEHPQLTLAMSDPDAPSRDDPRWGQVCHWLVTDVQLSSGKSNDSSPDTSELTEIMSYTPPGPPKKTGRHRYIFVALSPKNGTTDKLNLSEPSDKYNWGYGQAGAGIRDWAQDNGLVVVGANFLYSKHKKQ